MSTPTLQETGFPWVGNYTDYRIIPFLEGYFEATRNIQLEATIIIVPVIGLILILTYEALGIGRSSIQEELERYQREGVRFENVLSLLAFERLVTSFISISVALLLLKPVVRALLGFTNYFEKSDEVIPLIGDSSLIAIAASLFNRNYTFAHLLHWS